VGEVEGVSEITLSLTLMSCERRGRGCDKGFNLTCIRAGARGRWKEKKEDSETRVTNEKHAQR
jgi:hypothetical protein